MKEGFRVSKKNLVLIGILALGLFLYALLGTYMTMRHLDEARESGLRLEDSLKTQELLYPVYTGIQRSLSEPEPAEGLDLPAPQPLSGDMLRDLQGLFRPLVSRSGLELKDLLPDADGYDPRVGLLSLSLVVTGRASDFHAFLVDLGTLAFVETFLSLEILSRGEGREMRLKMQLRMQPGGE